MNVILDKSPFQFLYGAIKSQDFVQARSHQCYFNSSMVRLKAAASTTKKALFPRPTEGESK